MKIKGVAVLLSLWMAVSGALLFSSIAFGRGRTEIEQIITRPYERLYEFIREVEHSIREFLDGGRGNGSGSGRVKDCSCL